MAHRRSLRAQALPHRGICIWRTSKQAPGCRQLSSKYRRLKVNRSNGKPASGVGHEETIKRVSSVAGVMRYFNSNKRFHHQPKAPPKPGCGPCASYTRESVAGGFECPSLKIHLGNGEEASQRDDGVLRAATSCQVSRITQGRDGPRYSWRTA